MLNVNVYFEVERDIYLWGDSYMYFCGVCFWIFGERREIYWGREMEGFGRLWLFWFGV